jgi:tetratricopeptide (TPR) repeat protein
MTDRKCQLEDMRVFCNAGFLKIQIRMSQARPPTRRSSSDSGADLKLQLARQWHGQRQFAAAISMYREALAVQPDHAAALCWLGTALAEAWRLEEAVPVLSRAHELRPEAPEPCRNLAVVLLQLGRKQEALASFERLVRLSPQDTAAQNDYGGLLLEFGRHLEATAALDRALQLEPEQSEARFNRAQALQALFQHREALADYDVAVQQQPGSAAAWHNRGLVLAELGEHGRALESFQRALALDTACAPAHCGASKALYAMCRWDEALCAAETALRLDPRMPEAWVNQARALLSLKRDADAIASCDAALGLIGEGTPAASAQHAASRQATALAVRGLALATADRLEEALAEYQCLVQLNPGSAPAWSNLGYVQHELGLHADALTSLDRALAIWPNHPEGQYGRASILLGLGRYLEAWNDFEARWRLTRMGAVPHPDRPRWLGEDPTGRTILLSTEQGFGDAIQFCRYAPLLAAHGARVIVEAPRELAALLRTLPGGIEVIARGDTLPPFDAQCPLMTLPGLFGTALESVPARIPYLSADPQKTDAWRGRLGEGPHVGLVLSGSRTHMRDRVRSIGLEQIAPLLDTDATFHLLQRDLAKADEEFLAGCTRVLDHRQSLLDFTDTAALTSCMDLVISVDTSVAHLAGALGRPLWVLLPLAADWRWLQSGEQTPWYPAARLFRQFRRGDWQDVIARAASALSAKLT